MTPRRKFLAVPAILFALGCMLAGGASSAAQTIPASSNSQLSTKTNGRYTLLSMQISPTTLSLKPGATSQLSASGMGSDQNQHTVTAHVQWSSSAPSVATVSSAGLVTAVSAGTATITATRGVAASATITVTNQANGIPVPASLFSMTTHGRIDMPTVPVVGLRLWSTGTYWYMMNTAQGVYDFTTLDQWISTAQANNFDLIYTFGEMPAWASSNPTLVCGTANVPAGSCVAPNDVNADGTGTDQHFKDFVTAIVTHAAGQIKYWEMWNEPTVPGYWQGNNAQMLRMAQDAYGIIKSIDPTAVVTTPSPSTGVYGVANWMGPYLALGGGQYADIITFHGYSWSPTWGVWPQPEDIVPLVENLKAQLAIYGQTNKPLWCTEGSWGDTSGNGFTDPDLHAAFLARHYLLQESEGVVRYYWFAWDNGGDGLWNASTGMSKSGVAYQQVESWILGTTPTGKCTQNGTLWTCNYSKSGGFLAEAIWDTSQTCSNGNCTTSNVSVGSQYSHYLDLNGTSFPITNATVPVGAKPIFLENQ